MKELSIEEKAKAYDETLERAKKWYYAPNADKMPTYANRIIKEIFPELKESEGERIRKDIISFVEQAIDTGYGIISKERKEKWIAWLEKQGNLMKALQISNAKIGELVEKNYYLKEQLEKQGEQKSADKVEPKFKIGDWVVRGKTIAQILDIQEQYYVGLDIDGNDFTSSRFLSDDKIHLWTIQDAKAGDVLLSPSTLEGDKESPFIFKEIDKSGIIRFYVALLQSEKLKIADGITNVMGYANAGYHTPATKEQRDLLFQKMKEAGYEWDADKKQLKKIEQKPAWSEEDESMLFNVIHRIEQLDHYWNKPTDEKMIDWLKSLKERYTWKPSDEQMETLKSSTYCKNEQMSKVLFELYQDLKKLREA